jgi:ABC-type arginine transport system permease subunit
MTELPSPSRRHREAKSQFDTTVVGIELTVISIIQGLALGVLVAGWCSCNGRRGRLC